MNPLYKAISTLLDGFDAEIERRASELSRPKGGQSVQPGGDFVNVPPSALGRLRWWSRAFREVLAPPLSPDYVLGQERMRERADSNPIWCQLHRLWTKAVGTPDYVKREWQAFEADLFPVRSLPLEDAGEGAAKLTSHPFGPPFLYGPGLCHCGFPESAHATAAPAPSPSPAPDYVLGQERMRERASPDDLRAAGWVVAIHNDYRLNGEPHTFWLFTRDGRAVKGEGRTDAEALDQIRSLPLEDAGEGVPGCDHSSALGTCDSQTGKNPHTRCYECVGWEPIVAPAAPAPSPSPAPEAKGTGRCSGCGQDLAFAKRLHAFRPGLANNPGGWAPPFAPTCKTCGYEIPDHPAPPPGDAGNEREIP